jgi:hypothetical protein
MKPRKTVIIPPMRILKKASATAGPAYAGPAASAWILPLETLAPAPGWQAPQVEGRFVGWTEERGSEEGLTS